MEGKMTRCVAFPPAFGDFPSEIQDGGAWPVGVEACLIKAAAGTGVPYSMASGKVSAASSRSLYFWILPLAVWGKASITET